jgi:streptomycin 6-kinase
VTAIPAAVRAVPDVVRAKAAAAGPAGWLADLPGIIASLEQDWAITVGPPAVLKLLVPRAGHQARNEITFLELAGGRGCVSLLRADLSRSALLLERLGPCTGRQMLQVADRVAK